MKSFKIFLLAMVFGYVAVGASYAQGVPGKIAYVDLAKVFDDYGKTKDYDAVLEKKHDAFVAEHKEKEQKIKDAEAKLALMKEAEKGKLQAQIDKDKNDLLAFDRQRQMDLRKDRDEKIREILAEIEKVVKDFAKQGGYALIVNDRVLIYGAEELNVTASISEILNSKTPPAKK